VHRIVSYHQHKTLPASYEAVVSPIQRCRVQIITSGSDASLSQQSWISCITLVSYQSFYTDLNAEQSPRWTYAGLLSWSLVLQNTALNQMEPICSQWGGERNNRATKSYSDNPATASLLRCQDHPNGSPTRELEETYSASPYHVAEHRPVRSESVQSHTEWNSQPGSELSSVEADVQQISHVTRAKSTENGALSLYNAELNETMWVICDGSKLSNLWQQSTAFLWLLSSVAITTLKYQERPSWGLQMC